MAEYDYIVVGGGSAGCVVAGRLSEDPSCRVLLIEAGRSDRTAFCRKPGMISMVHTVPQIKKKFDWGYYTVPRPETIERKIPYTRGKVLGGSSAINGLLFVRGNRANYDDWAAEGCAGWSFDEVLPYFKRLESYDGGESDLRGGGGPVAVTTQESVTPISQKFLHAVAETCGVDIIADYNGASQEGASLFQASSRDGLRYSTAEAYIHPHLGVRPNLEVRLHAQVSRVVIEKGRAVGVELFDKRGQVVVERATSEVVLSAGVVGSPQILMLSGVGPAAHLREHGITVNADLPVGDNLHDHMFFPLVFLAPGGLHRGTAGHFFGGMLAEYTRGGTWFGKTVFESVAFVKTGSDQPIPNLQIHSLPWAYPAPNQDKPVRPKVDKRPALTVLPTLIYPKSRGTIRLASANPQDAPLIDPGFLREAVDRELLMDGIALTREIMASGPMKGEVTGELEPGPSFFDRKALEKELPNRAHTVYHPVGTCRMGVDERAVVDPTLRVRGIDGLRVADAAIMPSVTGGNTNAPCIMIGEKCADLLRA